MPGWWPCPECCYTLCAVFADDFDDAASTTLSSDWEEAGAGGCEYDGSGHLSISGTAGDRAICIAETTTREQLISGTIDNLTAGRKYRIYFNMDGLNNGHIVEVEPGSPDTIRWFKLTGGSEALLREETIQSGSLETETEISVCSHEVSITVSFVPSPTGEFWYHPDPSLWPKGKRAGVGNGGTDEIKFTDFDLSNYRGTDGQNQEEYKCCVYQCTCTDETGEHAIPHVLEATLYAPGLNNGCGDLDGYVMDLAYYSLVGGWVSYDNASSEHHDGATPQGPGLTDPPDQPHPNCNDDSWWVMACGESTYCNVSVVGATFNLTNNVGPGGSCTPFSECIAFDDAEVSFDCEPFTVTFPRESYGAYDPSPLCPCCDDQLPGYIWVIVTEK